MSDNIYDQAVLNCQNFKKIQEEKRNPEIDKTLEKANNAIIEASKKGIYNIEVKECYWPVTVIGLLDKRFKCESCHSYDCERYWTCDCARTGNARIKISWYNEK